MKLIMLAATLSAKVLTGFANWSASKNLEEGGREVEQKVGPNQGMRSAVHRAPCRRRNEDL